MVSERDLAHLKREVAVRDRRIAELERALMLSPNHDFDCDARDWRNCSAANQPECTCKWSSEKPAILANVKAKARRAALLKAANHTREKSHDWRPNDDPYTFADQLAGELTLMAEEAPDA